MYLDTDLTPLTKINSKIDYRAQCKMQIIKFPDNNMGKNLSDLGFSNEFLDITPKAQFIIEKLILGFIKILKLLLLQSHY